MISLILVSCSTTNNDRKLASTEDGTAIKNLSERIDNSIQNFDDYSSLSSDQKIDLLGALGYVRSKLVDYGMYSDQTSHQFGAEIEFGPISRSSGGNIYRIEVSPESSLYRVSIEALNGKVKVYKVELVYSDGSSEQLSDESSNEFVENYPRVLNISSDRMIKEIKFQSEAWGDNINLLVKVHSESEVQLQKKRVRTFYCNSEDLYQGRTYITDMGSNSRCEKAARSENNGRTFYCNSEDLYQGRTYITDMGNNSRCEKAARSENNGRVFYCNSEDLYQGRTYVTDMGNNSRCERAARSENSGRAFYCNSEDLYQGRSYVTDMGNNGRCEKAARSENSGRSYYCNSEDLYQGKTYVTDMGNSSRCEKAARSENNGRTFYCNSEDLYQGKTYVTDMGNSSRCQSAADSEDENL